MKGERFGAAQLWQVGLHLMVLAGLLSATLFVTTTLLPQVASLLEQRGLPLPGFVKLFFMAVEALRLYGLLVWLAAACGLVWLLVRGGRLETLVKVTYGLAVVTYAALLAVLLVVIQLFPGSLLPLLPVP